MTENQFSLTADEQIRLVNGAAFFGTGAIPEKGIPELQLLDGGTGINFEQLFGDMVGRAGLSEAGSDALRNVLRFFYTPEKLPDEASRNLHQWITGQLAKRIPAMTPPGCYPPGMLLGATWNPEVIERVGTALGKEARAYGVDVLLGTPNVNLHRDIRNGRLFEGYSEDPCLVAELAPALVRGVQSQGVAANVKHFAANHQETNRMGVDELITERALHELYYPGFRACVEAGVETVMSAYNKINGVPCTENRVLLHDLLRDAWGFKGVVMSDWNAVYHPAEALNAGNDLAMPGPIAPDVLTDALAEGRLSAEALAESAQRVAELAVRYAKPATGEIPVEETDQAAYDAAAEGIVLLKNEGNALPLASSAHIALYGEHAENLLTCGEGSAGILTTRNVSFCNALAERFEGVALRDLPDQADTLIYVYSLSGREGNDRDDISLPSQVTAEWEGLLNEIGQRDMKKVLILNVSAPVALDGWEKHFDAILCVFLPGMQGANALADCLCGKVNPSGKLPTTWPRRIEDMPTFMNFPGDGMQVHYGEGIFVGYRWYDARKIEPLYPFGHGLSYTDFAIEALRAERETFTDSAVVTATLVNRGSCAGKTVLQLYISDPSSTLTKPVRELKAFRKVFLKPQERTEISFTLDRHCFESYDPNLHAWTLEEGFYTITAGLSSSDLQAECSVYADVASPYSYGAGTSIKVLMERAELQIILRDFFDRMSLPWTAILTSYEYSAQDTIGQVLTQLGCKAQDQQRLYDQLQDIRKP